MMSTKKVISSATLQQIQQRELRIYKEIKRICDTHNIRYFAVAGTAIGTVRHKGFIPWDDDIDIAMPRSDYEKFMKLGHLLPSDLTVTDYTNNLDSTVVFNKVMETTSCYSEPTALTNPATCYGVYVDIMPLDGVPETWLFYKLHWLRLCMLSVAYNFIIKYEHRTPIDSARKKPFIKAAGLLSRLGLLRKKTLRQKFMKLVRKYDFDSSTYSAYVWIFTMNAGVNNRARFRTDDFKSYVEMPFEDTTMRLPKGWENHLYTVCPDYMTPPPVEKQIPQHSGIIDFDKSYLEYAKEAQQRKNKLKGAA